MDVLNATPVGYRLGLSLPLILFNFITHVFGLALIYDTFTFLLQEAKIRHQFMIRLAKVMSGFRIADHRSTWTGDDSMGLRLSFFRRTAGQQVGNALLAWRDETGFEAGDISLPPRSTAFAASSRNFDLNGEARTARTKQSFPIIPPA
jgi:hypothetical protein